MARRMKRGGGDPGYRMLGVNVDNGLRRKLERACRRRGISLTKYAKACLEQGVAQEQWFWKFQALRSLVQTLRMALSSEFVEKTLDFKGERRNQFNAALRDFVELIEQKADEQWMENLSPEEREKEQRRRAINNGDGLWGPMREPYRIPRRPGIKAHPHWSFEIPEVERILNAL